MFWESRDYCPAIDPLIRARRCICNVLSPVHTVVGSVLRDWRFRPLESGGNDHDRMLLF